MALDKLVFTVDTATNKVTAVTQSLLNLQHCTTNCAGVGTPVWVADYPADANTAAIVAAAVARPVRWVRRSWARSVGSSTGAS